jgi:hypothetical protein
MFGVRAQERFGEAFRFATKDEKIGGTEFCIGIGTLHLGSQKVEGRGGISCAQGFPILPAVPGDMLPIVHSGSFHSSVVEPEAEGFDQVENRTCGGAEARDGAGVGRDFRFHQDDLELSGIGHLAYRGEADNSPASSRVRRRERSPERVTVSVRGARPRSQGPRAFPGPP